ncbi:hypothetical protein OC846_005750 [Tilletia horrida]|uniref:Uncharacterized protein n=1 Tax=Tilletia horrida TaxID=155126 RepID=A0AAN6JRE3_9BASI|nr:hypothetical protein OC846_005750 [Tilletia horrida]KAK0552312.1 hypothetical protein OC845_001792 [Tilletia horrida]
MGAFATPDRIEDAQLAAFARGMTNAAYRPKYVCWPCRRTFKPTVCPGKRVVHTAYFEEHGIVETTSGQIRGPPAQVVQDNSLSASTAKSPKQKHKATYERHPASDPRLQTVWAVHDDPGASSMHQRVAWRSRCSPDGTHQPYTTQIESSQWKKARGACYVYQDQRRQDMELHMRSAGLGNTWHPNHWRDTSLVSDDGLAEMRASIPSHLLPPRIVVTCCPECGEVGTRIGPNFRAPPRKDVKAWKEVERRTTEDGEDWTFCIRRQELEWMHELVPLIEARMKLEGGTESQEGAGEGSASASGSSSSSRSGKRPVDARVSGKDRRREAELRSKLGLSCSEIQKASKWW